MMATRRRRRRRNRTPLFLLLLLLLTGMVLLLISCGDRDGEGLDGDGEPTQGDAANPGDTEGEGDIQEPEEPEPDPYEGYTIRTMTEQDMGSGEQILVSNAVPYTFPEGAAEELVVVIHEKNNSYMSKDYETSLLPVTVSHLNDMMKDYTDQGGAVNIMVVSGHRTYDFQQKVFDSSAARNGLEHAQRFVAQPGGSEHHTGYALDLWNTTVGDYFEGVGECKWITDNCHKYGFILRYSEEKETFTKIGPESWHFRYIGVPHSYLVVEKGFCYEEYIDYLKEFPFLEDHLFTTVDGVEYEIYYVEGLEVPVPEEGEYTVSGNNLDGFIVTVTKTTSVGEPPQVPAA
jgi:D-alanyl-D-alanine carboxypeptidase